MQKTVMTFGDSNTYGTPPTTAAGTAARFGIGIRWPTVMHAALQGDWHLVEEGLPGRTAGPGAHPVMGAHMDGQLGLHIALASHGPLDMLVLMLGTNDLQTCFWQDAQGVAAGIAGLLAIARSAENIARHPDMDILLIAPPPIREGGIYGQTLMGAPEASLGLAACYQALATHWAIGFLDAGALITSCPEDAVHFDAAAHKTLGLAVAQAITPG